jgi:hypothetical protein
VGYFLDYVLPLDEIVPTLVRLVSHKGELAR